MWHCIKPFKELFHSDCRNCGYYLGGFFNICFIGDIITIKKSISATKEGQGSNPVTKTIEDDPNTSMRNDMKSNPQSVLSLSNILEKQLGRKPSYDEVMDYIDHMESQKI